MSRTSPVYTHWIAAVLADRSNLTCFWKHCNECHSRSAGGLALSLDPSPQRAHLHCGSPSRGLASPLAAKPALQNSHSTAPRTWAVYALDAFKRMCQKTLGHVFGIILMSGLPPHPKRSNRLQFAIHNHTSRGVCSKQNRGIPTTTRHSHPRSLHPTIDYPLLKDHDQCSTLFATRISLLLAFGVFVLSDNSYQCLVKSPLSEVAAQANNNVFACASCQPHMRLFICAIA
jgi:hypothetical protein